jgi:hypothetical protein
MLGLCFANDRAEVLTNRCETDYIKVTANRIRSSGPYSVSPGQVFHIKLANDSWDCTEVLWVLAVLGPFSGLLSYCWANACVLIFILGQFL